MSEVISWVAILSGGLVVTIELSAFTALFTIAFSALLAICRVSPWRWARMLASLYADLFRSIPLLALLIFLYYGLGRVAVQFGISGFWLVVAGLALSESAYLGEVYRGGLLAIPQSQWEAAASLGLGWPSILRRVVLPQAVPSAIPSTLNMLISIIKNSSLASLVAVSEVTLVATILVSETFEPMQVYLVLAMLYLAIIIPVSLVSRWLESRVGHANLSLAEYARVPAGPQATVLPEV
jgi:His/Glu/Gln/Arg/opine family amino acid ABC transporter permease subunit